MTGDAHAKFSPSSASRWLVCNDSVNYQPEDRANDFANEAAKFGTEIHEWIACDTDAPSHWTDEQFRDAKLCLDEWRKHVPADAEREVKLFSKSWPDLFFGTLDAVWVDDSGCVNIADLKSGLRGVSAADNAQLLCYTLLASEKFPSAATFRVMIIQPRRSYFASNVYSREQILAFGERVRRAIESPPEKVAGPHCEFCNARLHCDVLHNSLFKLLADAQESGLWTSNHMKALNPCCA